jgi:hypothetical protein
MYRFGVYIAAGSPLRPSAESATWRFAEALDL